MTTPEMEQAVDLVFSTEVRKYIALACITIYLYDTLGLLPTEFKLIWSAPWSIVKALYILTRYSPISFYIVSIYYGFYDRDWSPGPCLAVNKYLAWSIYVCMFFPEIIFAIRTWAVWGRGLWMGIFLGIFTCCAWLATFVVLYFNTQAMKPLPVPKYIQGPGCVAISTNPLGTSTLVTVLILLFYGVSFPLMLIRLIQQHGLRTFHHTTYLVRTVYLDGLLYYFYLMLIAIGTVIVNTKGPASYVGLLAQPQQTLAGLLACRMTLELRGYVFKPIRVNISDISLTTEPGTRPYMDTLMFRRPNSVLDTNKDEIGEVEGVELEVREGFAKV